MNLENIKHYFNQFNYFSEVENFDCDNCQAIFHRATTYSIAQNREELKDYPIYCINCVKLAEQELKTLIENVQTILKVVEDTYQHEKEEWELNKDKSEDYVIINKEIVELEQEIAEWQNVLTELENKLGNFQIGEQQTQIIQQ